MAADQSHIDSLARNPSESLTTEVKTWIDPRTSEGAAKVVRACIALRNAGGGFLLIGFNNDTGRPDTPAPNSLDEQFHIDLIQGLVTKHSSEPFAVDVRWTEFGTTRHPVIEVPPGVKSPVAAKSPIDGADGKKLVREHAVYVRSLQSNNTPATTEAIYRDWPSIVDVCFENREADIGRFLRRHLRGVTADVIRELTVTLQKAQAPTAAEQTLQTLEDGGSRFRTRLAASNPDLSPLGINEVAFVIPLINPSPVKPNTTFLNADVAAGGNRGGPRGRRGAAAPRSHPAGGVAGQGAAVSEGDAAMAGAAGCDLRRRGAGPRARGRGLCVRRGAGLGDFGIRRGDGVAGGGGGSSQALTRRSHQLGGFVRFLFPMISGSGNWFRT